MTVSFRKTKAVCKLKAKMIFNNRSVLMGPLMSIGFVILYKNLMPVEEMGEQFATGFFLNMGVLFNTLMTGLMASSLPLAEDKEKHTLRVLMTSSINSIEFFIGSLLPVFVMTEAVNLIMLPLSGASVSIPLYFLLTSVCVFITMLLGACCGLAGKDQTSTSLMMTPFLLVLMLPPMLSAMAHISWIQFLTKFLYTGILSRNLNQMISGSGFDYMDVLYYVIWVVVVFAAFVMLYRRNRIDRD